MQTRDVMTREVQTVLPDTPVHEIARLMVRHGVSGLPVVMGDGHVVGIVCELDLIARNARLEAPAFFRLLDGWLPLETPQHFSQRMGHMLGTLARDVMTGFVVSVSPETDLADLTDLMLRQRINPVPVLDHGQLVGIVSRSDILRMMSRQMEAHAA